MKHVSLKFCENCVYVKQKRVIFLKVGKQKMSEKLELVHTYVWGLDHVQYLGGSRYYVTFIDDATIKLGFIVLDKNMMCLLLLRSGNIWLRMRRGES